MDQDAETCLLCLGFSDIDLFGNGKRIVHLDPEIADRALYLRVAEQELNDAKIPRLFVDEGCFGPTK
jgi:hypothetical protein